ncbi:MAG TPA: hypothetical protein VND91_11595 [Candidatus Saccharimonadia bacterium]|nr:hypothetical protein [Candidatus Saccharimonadia bacterium]
MIASVAVLMLAACRETPTETASDVAKAQEEAARESSEARREARESVAEADADVAEAARAHDAAGEATRKKLSAVEAEAMIEHANASYDVAIAETEGRHAVATEACDALTGVDKEACVSTADATLAAERASATATRDAALVDAAHHD